MKREAIRSKKTAPGQARRSRTGSPAIAGKRVWVCLALLVSLTGMLSATQYYVDVKNGNDLNSGLSLASPWKTLKTANQRATSGDVIFIREGVYSEADGYHSLIHPQNSGSSGNYITYKNYENESVVLTGCYQPILLGNPTTSYIKIDGLTVDGGNRATSAVDVFAMVYGDHNVIQNCTLKNERTTPDWWKGIYITGAYNRILNCTISNVGNAIPPDSGVGDGIWVEGERNLIENNNISYCGHNGLLLRGKYNIARRNVLDSRIYRSCEVHSSGSARSHLVFDSNIVRDSAGYTPGPCAAYGMQVDAPGAIIRKNVFYNNHGHGLEVWAMIGGATGAHMRVYQNSLARNGLGSGVGAQEGYGIELNQISESTPGDFKDVIVKNNILYKNKNAGVYYKPGTDPNDHLEANNFKDSNGIPYFADESNNDFHLTLGSPCIDAGAFLTKTAQGGTGSSIFVEDAGYFIDGFGIVEGDLIQLQGQTDPARIIYVDYDNKLISIDRTLTWSSGQGISLAYKGSAPEIGAFEYEDASSAPLVAMVDASPTTGQAPLAVAFTAGASGGTSPYTYSWNFGDGGTSASQNVSHTYTSTGTYTATLTTTDDKGASATATQVISVTNSPVALSAAVNATPTSGQAPLNVNFTAVASGGTLPYVCSWDFGDGQTAVGSTAAHTFTAAGNYTTVLVITDGLGAVTQAMKSISVAAAANPLTITVAASKTSGRAPLGITFSARIAGGTSPYVYSWNFGDGGTSYSAAPFHSFSSPGSYTVTVTISDNNGARGAASIVITANDKPRPDLRFWPGSLRFSAGAAPSSFQISPVPTLKKHVIRIVKTGPAAILNWTITASESWISFSRTSGTGSGNVLAIIDTSYLVPGVYSATINVSAPDALHPFQTIPVMLTVADPVT